MTAQIVPVNPDRLDMVWPTVEPWLDAAMKHGPRLYGTADVLAACKEKSMILWVAIISERVIGMTVTSLETYPQMTILVARWAGGPKGQGRQWIKDMIDELKHWGRAWDASLLTGGGRRGWLSGFGFVESGVLFTMDLTT
jgi:hypothetical protein